MILYHFIDYSIYIIRPWDCGVELCGVAVGIHCLPRRSLGVIGLFVVSEIARFDDLGYYHIESIF